MPGVGRLRPSVALYQQANAPIKHEPRPAVDKDDGEED